MDILKVLKVETSINIRTHGLPELIMAIVKKYGNESEIKKAKEWLYNPGMIEPDGFTVINVLFDSLVDASNCKIIIKAIGKVKLPFLPVIKTCIIKKFNNVEKEMIAGKYLNELLDDAKCKENLVVLYKKWKQAKEETITRLKDIADNMSKVRKHVNIFKLTGSSVGIVGTTAGLSALTVASVFTGGIALGIAGAAVGTVGGLTCIGTEIASHKLTKKAETISEELLKLQQETTENLIKELEIYKEKNKRSFVTASLFSDVLLRFKKINKERVKVTICIGNVIEKEIGYVKSVVKEVRKIAGKNETMLKIVTNGGKVISRLVGTGSSLSKSALTLSEEAAGLTLRAVSNGLRIVGIVSGAVLIAIDLYTIVSTSIEVHKNSPDKAAEMIRQAAEELENRDDPELEEMIIQAQLDAADECQVEHDCK